MAAQWYQRGADGVWRSPGRPPLSDFVLGDTKPDASNTGLAAAGISPEDLEIHDGDWTIDSPGTYEGYLIRGLVRITADDVVFRHNLPVGRQNPSYNGGALIVSSGNNVLVDECDLTAWDYMTETDNTIYWLNGFKVSGGSAMIRRCNIHDVVDGVGLGGGTGKVYGNYVHDVSYRDDDADIGPGGTPPYGSHNDGVQVAAGSNHEIVGNNFHMNFSVSTGMPTYINPGWSAGDSPLGLDPGWPDENLGVVRWDNAHGVGATKGGAIVNLHVAENWMSYAQQAMIFTTGSSSGNTASLDGNRITPNQSMTGTATVQVMIDATGVWTVTGIGTSVYSDDPMVPPAWQGHELQPPISSSGYTVFQNPNWSLTP